MRTYDVEQFMRLVEVWPESLNMSKVVSIYEDKPGRFGMERVYKGTETITLAASILDTANAIGIKYGNDRALSYVDEFKPARVKKQETANFLKER